MIAESGCEYRQRRKSRKSGCGKRRAGRKCSSERMYNRRCKHGEWVYRENAAQDGRTRKERMKNERCHCTEEKVERRKLNLESNRRLRNFAPLLCSLTQAQWLRGSSTALQLYVYVAPLRISRLNGSVALESSFCTSSGSRHGKITSARDRGLRGALGSGTRPTQRRSTVRCVECERTHWCRTYSLNPKPLRRQSASGVDK